MSLFDRILGAASKRTEKSQEALTGQVKEKLKALVYDDELVDELLPTFTKLWTQEGFSTVLELLETKEKQLETISNGDWFKQDTDPETKEDTSKDSEESQDEVSMVDEILSKRYGE